MKGIDISVYNGKVNLKEAKKQGVDFCIMKIIDKNMNIDKEFIRSQQECERFGIPWGVYNYTYAVTATKAKKDMSVICDILDKLSTKYLKLGIWFDIEDREQERMSKSKITDMINAAQDVVEKRGYSFGVYTGLAFYNAHIDRKNIDCNRWWIARYYRGYTGMNIKDAPDAKYKPISGNMIWQYTSTGKFNPGISSGNGGSFDLNIMYGNLFDGAKQNNDKKGGAKKVYDRTKVIKKAESYLGTKEGSAKHKEILKRYNENKPLPQNYIVKPTDAWCATFSSAMYIACGYADIFPIECSCSRMIERAKKMNIWQEKDFYVPSVADAVLYDWQDSGKGDNKGNPDHVGLVSSVDKKNGTMKIIEGNYHDKVGYRVIDINGRYIRGFVTPKFDTESKPKKEGSGEYMFNVKTIKEGSKGNDVLLAQKLLRVEGYYKGSLDKDFGQNTKKAAKEYQKAHKLTVNGVIEANTWKSLLGV